MLDNTDNKKRIGIRLRWAREQAGLSQGQVALQMNLHRPTISQIEAGDRNVRIDEIERLAELYGVNQEWLMKGDAALAGERDPRIELVLKQANVSRNIAA
jgi:transcriptional regulator with XRE-family HTH domain